MRERVITARSYTVAVTVDELLKIGENDREETYQDSLYDVLDKIIGVYGADYNGHFGKFIFFSIEADQENDETWAAIDEAIEQYVR